MFFSVFFLDPLVGGGGGGPKNFRIFFSMLDDLW